nr:MAG TPA: hypothetical protein [Caudoviricetes sp.]
MTAAMPTSREPMASIAFQTSSISHLLPLFRFRLHNNYSSIK